MQAVPAAAEQRASIIDRYVIGTRLRLRRVESADGLVFKLGQKVRVDPADPEVVKLTNIYLSGAEYAVLAGLPAAELRKTRWLAPANGRTLAIDELHDRLDGLVLGEVELAGDDSFLPAPPFAIRDVTNDDRFSGGALAFATDAAIDALLSELSGGSLR
jgi:CYTH domain-containing protein